MSCNNYKCKGIYFKDFINILKLFIFKCVYML